MPPDGLAAVALLNPGALKRIADDMTGIYTGLRDGLKNMFNQNYTEEMRKEAQAAGLKLVRSLVDLLIIDFQGIPGLLMKPLQDMATNLGVALHNAIGGMFSSLGHWIGGLFHHTNFMGPAIGGGAIHKAAYLHAAFSSGTTPASHLIALSDSSAGRRMVDFHTRNDATGIPSSRAWRATEIETAMRNSVPPSRTMMSATIPIDVKLEGKVVAKSVTKRQVELATMPLGIHGAPDSYGSFTGPGTTLQPA